MVNAAGVAKALGIACRTSMTPLKSAGVVSVIIEINHATTRRSILWGCQDRGEFKANRPPMQLQEKIL